MKKGCSSKQVGKNIGDMLMHRHGHKKTYTQAQAVKIALDFARKQGCPISRSNPPQDVMKWFKVVYKEGQMAADLINQNVLHNITSDESNKMYKLSMRRVENKNGVIFNKIEKGLFLEGFLHTLMGL